ncbi:MAG: pyridoxal phosphate-dependent aminotransferase [Gemmataceae bacterium]|nr:pyridoxal phosphate-dependent aminotransferase [Gemmataceae bacterium]
MSAHPDFSHLSIVRPSAVVYPLFLTKLLIQSGIARLVPAIRRLTDGGGAFLHYYSNRVLAAPHAELRGAGVFLEPHAPDTIDLGLGAPRFDLMPTASTKLPADRRGCPPLWGLPELHRAIVDKVQMDHAVQVGSPDEVLVTAGTAGAFNLVLDAFLNPDDKVVLFDPTSPLYRFALRQRRARVRWVPSSLQDGRTRFRLEPLAHALRNAKLIVLASPNNPTGGVFAPEDLEQIAWWADRRDVLIFNDEAFQRYSYEDPLPSILAQPKARRRTLTAGSVSKSHALASLRVGWLTGHRHLIRPCALTAVLQAALVPTLCQQLAATALRQPADTFEPIRQEFDSRRHYVHERLHAIGLQPSLPVGGFFFWLPVWTLGLSGREFADRLLHSKKVLVWPGEYFGPSGKGYVRLSYAVEDGRLREGLARLTDFVRDVQVASATGKVRRAA